MKKKNFNFIFNYAIHIAIFIFFLSFAIVSFGYFRMKSVKDDIQRLEGRITDIETQMEPSEEPIEQTEYIKAIDYLESETTKYRGFIQEQQDYLVWLYGVAAAAFLTLMTFFGIESRKKISDVFREQYDQMVKDEFSHFIGGKEKREYLIGCIEKENRAKNKRILFLKQREADKNLEKIYEFLRDHEYNVRQKRIENSMKEEYIGKIIKNYDVVIYQVDESECEGQKSGDKPVQSKCRQDKETEIEKNYVKISRQCNDKKIYGIFYSKDRIDLKKCYPCFYVSTVNFGATLLERINSILYFTQELSDDRTV